MVNQPRTMTLQEALGFLTRAHTRDDELTGYTVEMLPRIEEWEHSAYLEAWGVARDYLHAGMAGDGISDGLAEWWSDRLSALAASGRVVKADDGYRLTNG